ncbi:hypothetical protein Tsp_03901, partial [Trichinella spiralis]
CFGIAGFELALWHD